MTNICEHQLDLITTIDLIYGADLSITERTMLCYIAAYTPGNDLPMVDIALRLSERMGIGLKTFYRNRASLIENRALIFGSGSYYGEGTYRLNLLGLQSLSRGLDR